MLIKKFRKKTDFIISDEFRKISEENNDPFFKYFIDSINYFFPDEFEVEEIFLRSMQSDLIDKK